MVAISSSRGSYSPPRPHPQGSNLHLLCLLHGRRILYLLSYWGSPYNILCNHKKEWENFFIQFLGRKKVTCRTLIHLQYSCLENLMDRGAWQATGHRDAQSWIHLKRFRTCSGKKYKWRDIPGGTWMWLYLPTQETQVWFWSGKIPHALEQLSLYATDTAARKPLIFHLWVKKTILCIESERIWRTLVTVGTPSKGSDAKGLGKGTDSHFTFHHVSVVHFDCLHFRDFGEFCDFD